MRASRSWQALLLSVVLTVSFAFSQAAPRSDLIDAQQLLRDLQTLSADDMEGRQVGTAGGAKARTYVLQRFKESGIQPFGEGFTQAFSFTGGRAGNQTERQGVNVVGRIDGKQSARRYIVVSAHYDHLGTRDGQVFNGADDNASGTAALFAIAKYFNEHRPANSLIVTAFDGEESGLRGARAFVKTPPVALSSIVVNVNLDMVGRAPDDKLFAAGTHTYPFLKPYLERVAAKAPVTLLLGHDDPGRRDLQDWTRDSDHFAFHEVKIPFIYLGVEDFEHIHKSTDDYGNMSHDFFVRAVETAVRVIQEFDAHLDAIAGEARRRGGSEALSGLRCREELMCD
ncbi:MAG TPA: M28 family peptidase [Vicinamibacterales bacterium]|nr:M28 family peptidase [Vicinamibacterales bacterium]